MLKARGVTIIMETQSKNIPDLSENINEGFPWATALELRLNRWIEGNKVQQGWQAIAEDHFRLSEQQQIYKIYKKIQMREK